MAAKKRALVTHSLAAELKNFSEVRMMSRLWHISATSADDAVVIYYSGHGSYVEFKPDEWEGQPKRSLVEAAVLGAENLALAQNILYCESGNAGEKLDHEIGIEFGLVSGEWQPKPVTQDGSAVIIEDERVFIYNRGTGATPPSSFPFLTSMPLVISL